jgi:hypothetical protein
MSTAFVLGNGVSRKNIELLRLQPYGKIYGCNALHREFVPDVLIATDRPIAEHIQNSGYSLTHRFHTRRPVEGLGALDVPQPYFGYSSGPIAAGIAAIDGHRRIYLLGFDMGPSPNNTINNIYAGSEFYKRADAPPTFTGNWVKQLTKIMGDHRQVSFVRVHGTTTAHIAQFDNINNLTKLDLDVFMDRINNKKDL